MTEPGMHKDNEFEGKVAVVTGAARNIGRAIALSLAAGGAKVAVVTRSNIEQARGVANEIKAMGCDADAFAAKNGGTVLSLGEMLAVVNSGGPSRD